MNIETDYLVVGTGTAGMAFTDALLRHSDATVTIVDRRHAPGGHWIDAYPFVRLHQPSTFYGDGRPAVWPDPCARDRTGWLAGWLAAAVAASRDRLSLRCGRSKRPSGQLLSHQTC